MTNASRSPATRMRSLPLRTAILNSRSLKIAVGDMHSPVPGRGNVKIRKRVGGIDCNAECSRDRRDTPEGILRFPRQYLIWQQCTDHYMRFTGRPRRGQLCIGSPTWAFHEGENTMLIDKTNGTIGAAADGSGNVKNTTTMANQCCST